MKLIKKIIGLMPVMALLIAATSCGESKSTINVELIPVKSGDKWGYVDYEGNFVINPQFDEAEIFVDGIAKVVKGEQYGFIDEEGKYVANPGYESATTFLEGHAWTVKKGGAPTLINKKGEEVLVMKEIERAWPFNEGLAKVEVEKDGDVKYGFINRKGEFEIEPVWDDAQFFSEGLAYVEQEGKKGFINKKGDMVICDSLLRFEMPCINGLIIVRNADRDYGLIDKKGKFVVNPQFKAMIPDGDWYIIETDNGWGWCDSDGKIVINPQFESLRVFGFGNNDFAPVRIGMEYGYVDRQGKIVINPQFDGASSFVQNKYAIVSQNEKIGIIDKEGKYKVNPQFKDVGMMVGLDSEFCLLTLADKDYVQSQYFNAETVVAELMKVVGKDGMDGINPDMTFGNILKKYGKDKPDTWGSAVQMHRINLGNDVVGDIYVEGDFYDMVYNGWWGYDRVMKKESKPDCITLKLDMSGKARNHDKELAEALAKKAGFTILKDTDDSCYAKGKYGKYEIGIYNIDNNIKIKMTCAVSDAADEVAESDQWDVASEEGVTEKIVTGTATNKAPALPENIANSIKSEVGMVEDKADRKGLEIADVDPDKAAPATDVDYDQVFTATEKMPEFPGGQTAMMNWIGQHLKYPATAHANHVQGRVVVKFVVKKDGSVGNVVVVRGKDPDLDKEAVRVVKSLPAFTPGTMNGKPVAVWYTLPINFRLSE